MRGDGLVLDVLVPGLALRNKPHLPSMTWLLPSRLPLSGCCRWLCLPAFANCPLTLSSLACLLHAVCLLPDCHWPTVPELCSSCYGLSRYACWIITVV